MSTGTTYKQAAHSELRHVGIKTLMMIQFSLAAVMAMGVLFSLRSSMDQNKPVMLKGEDEIYRRGTINEPIQNTRQNDTSTSMMEPRFIQQHDGWMNSQSVQQNLEDNTQRAILDPTSVKNRHYDEVQFLEDGTAFLFLDASTKGPNGFCAGIVDNKHIVTRIHYHVAACSVFDKMFGNRLAQLYGMKLIAYSLQIPFEFTCYPDKKEPNGAAFLMHLNELPIGPPPISLDGKQLTPQEVCDSCVRVYCSWSSDNLAMAAPYMIEDWKYLTRWDVMPVKDHDDAAIHLRLGDALRSLFGQNEQKGLFPHGTYIKLIQQAIQEKGHISTIGIVTAPFSGSTLRYFDRSMTDLSQRIALDLVDALQNAFPDVVRVTIHNYPGMTILESLARIRHARKVAICGCTTFCPYTLLATNGIGFMYKPVGKQSDWVQYTTKQYENIRLFEAPMLNGLMITNQKTGWKMPDVRVLRWLREQDPDVGNVDIVTGPIFRYKENTME